MECSKCGEKAHIVTTTRGTTTLLEAGAGGYVAATAGAKTGAAVGSLLCPGIGTAIGGFLGILLGAARGEPLPVVVPKLVDMTEAAEMLGVSLANFKKLEPKLPFKRKMVGHSVRFRNTDIVRYILSQEDQAVI